MPEYFVATAKAPPQDVLFHRVRRQCTDGTMASSLQLIGNSGTGLRDRSELRRRAMEKAIKSYSGAVRIAVVVILAMCIGATPLLAQNTAKGKRNKSALESVGGVPILTFTPGIASTTAGTGVSGYSGDGGLATSA